MRGVVILTKGLAILLSGCLAVPWPAFAEAARTDRVIPVGVTDGRPFGDSIPSYGTHAKTGPDGKTVLNIPTLTLNEHKPWDQSHPQVRLDYLASSLGTVPGTRPDKTSPPPLRGRPPQASLAEGGVWVGGMLSAIPLTPTLSPQGRGDFGIDSTGGAGILGTAGGTPSVNPSVALPNSTQIPPAPTAASPSGQTGTPPPPASTTGGSPLPPAAGATGSQTTDSGKGKSSFNWLQLLFVLFMARYAFPDLFKEGGPLGKFFGGGSGGPGGKGGGFGDIVSLALPVLALAGGSGLSSAILLYLAPKLLNKLLDGKSAEPGNSNAKWDRIGSLLPLLVFGAIALTNRKDKGSSGSDRSVSAIDFRDGQEKSFVCDEIPTNGQQDRSSDTNQLANTLLPAMLSGGGGLFGGGPQGQQNQNNPMSLLGPLLLAQGFQNQGGGNTPAVNHSRCQLASQQGTSAGSFTLRQLPDGRQVMVPVGEHRDKDPVTGEDVVTVWDNDGLGKRQSFTVNGVTYNTGVDSTGQPRLKVARIARGPDGNPLTAVSPAIEAKLGQAPDGVTFLTDGNANVTFPPEVLRNLGLTEQPPFNVFAYIEANPGQGNGRIVKIGFHREADGLVREYALDGNGNEKVAREIDPQGNIFAPSTEGQPARPLVVINPRLDLQGVVEAGNIQLVFDPDTGLYRMEPIGGESGSPEFINLFEPVSGAGGIVYRPVKVLDTKTGQPLADPASGLAIVFKDPLTGRTFVHTSNGTLLATQETVADPDAADGTQIKVFLVDADNGIYEDRNTHRRFKRQNGEMVPYTGTFSGSDGTRVTYDAQGNQRLITRIEGIVIDGQRRTLTRQGNPGDGDLFTEPESGNVYQMVMNGGQPTFVRRSGKFPVGSLLEELENGQRRSLVNQAGEGVIFDPSGRIPTAVQKNGQPIPITTWIDNVGYTPAATTVQVQGVSLPQRFAVQMSGDGTPSIPQAVLDYTVDTSDPRAPRIVARNRITGQQVEAVYTPSGQLVQRMGGDSDPILKDALPQTVNFPVNLGGLR